MGGNFAQRRNREQNFRLKSSLSNCIPSEINKPSSYNMEKMSEGQDFSSPRVRSNMCSHTQRKKYFKNNYDEALSIYKFSSGTTRKRSQSEIIYSYKNMQNFHSYTQELKQNNQETSDEKKDSINKTNPSFLSTKIQEASKLTENFRTKQDSFFFHDPDAYVFDDDNKSSSYDSTTIRNERKPKEKLSVLSFEGLRSSYDNGLKRKKKKTLSHLIKKWILSFLIMLHFLMFTYRNSALSSSSLLHRVVYHHSEQTKSIYFFSFLPHSFVSLLHSNIQLSPLLVHAENDVVVEEEAEVEVTNELYHDTFSSDIASPDNIFTPRSSHATCLFKGKIWMMGGRGYEYQTWNLARTFRFYDVWYSEDSISWFKSFNQTGDFEVQNFDVMVPGPITPWYARFGHTLTAYDYDNDGTEDVMLLTGGFSPDPSNDIWLTNNGEKWDFVEYAPWRGRAYHSAVQFKGSFFIIGGFPLNNEVWKGDLIRADEKIYRQWTGRGYIQTQWKFDWQNYADLSVNSFGIPWSARAGHSLTVQERYKIGENNTYIYDTNHPEYEAPKAYLYLTGGYGGWDESWYWYDGLRCKNDVWRTEDGANWEVMTHSAPWPPRAFHSVILYPDPIDTLFDYSSNSSAPRMWLLAGGYFGEKGNNIVSKMKGYIDLWSSIDGKEWMRTDREEGSGAFLYTNNQYAITDVNGVRVYLGKWGHTALLFNSKIVFIGGSAVEADLYQSAVFESNNYIFCDKEGITCNSVGRCKEERGGCVCPELYYGDYCENKIILSSAPGLRVMMWTYLAIFLLTFYTIYSTWF